MSEIYNHETYLSPYTWRYGSDAMRQVWSLGHQRRLWRQIWVALAETQAEIGIVQEAQVDDLRAHQDDIDIERAHELEQSLRHDLMAEVHTYAEQCQVGGSIIHLGATSMDIEDNAEVMRLRNALALIRNSLETLLSVMAMQMEAHAEQVCMAYTHLQPAEPTTVGYRLAFVAQDLLADYEAIKRVQSELRGKGFKGAVGTSASYDTLLEDYDMDAKTFESRIMAKIGLPAFDVAHQTYPRRQDWDVVNALAGIGMTANKFAFDVRVLQSPPIGEWHEPFGKKQIGSSAMPFKRNPVNAENMNSLARYLATLPRVAWDNAAHSLLERTLDDSGNRRTVLPEAFLVTDELLKRMTRIMKGLVVDTHRIEHGMRQYGVFAATERLLMALVKLGGNRQDLHEVIRQHSMEAWQAIRMGQENPLADLLARDGTVRALMAEDEIRMLLHAEEHIGDAVERTQAMVKRIKQAVNDEGA
jgi:adenylosuccinate lyase